jgi:hypothetical protein
MKQKYGEKEKKNKKNCILKFDIYFQKSVGLFKNGQK